MSLYQKGEGKKAGERRGSYGNVEEMLKRKREDSGERKEGEKDRIFRDNKKTPRSPIEERGGEGYEIREMMSKWREEMAEMMVELKGMRGMREDYKILMEEIKIVREQGKRVMEELDNMRREFRESERKWKEEKEELRKGMKDLEKRVEGNKPDGGRGLEGTERRIREMERKLETKEREERRKNIIIRGLEVKEGKRKEAVEELMGVMMKVNVKNVKRLGGKGGRRGDDSSENRK
ncbi:unnamed protein product [Lasius platythorax]|uniref:Uncharacterized protein n=1 Tax=Lasius platythorax TaxID=488582 RepID=A0AAV2N052_9HYME